MITALHLLSHIKAVPAYRQCLVYREYISCVATSLKNFDKGIFTCTIHYPCLRWALP